MINQSQGFPYSRLMSVAGARGSRVVTNEEMTTIIDSTDEWIQQRTGIKERRWVGEGETVLSLAVDAGRRALEKAGIQASELDAVIVATVSHFKQTPALAVYVARELGAQTPAAFDVSAACAGFSYLVSLADSMIRTGTAKHVLIIGAETLSKITNFEDRSTAFLFADGAGAAIVGPSETPAIGPVVWGTKSDDTSVITMEDWGELQEGGQPTIRMEGNKVYKWAVTSIAEKAVEALEAAGLQPEELDVFIPHQANNRITDAMLRRLNLPESVVVSRDIVNMGNSSAASIPLGMAALLESGEAKSGQTALIIGFGAGLVYAGQVLILP